MQGPAALYVSLEHSFNVSFMPVEKYIKAGITIESFERYMQSKEGDALWKQFGVTVPAIPRELVYIPAGCVVYTFGFQLPKGRGFRADNSVYIHWPLGGHVSNQVDPDVKQALVTWNHATFATKTTQMWIDRKACFDSIFAVAS